MTGPAAEGPFERPAGGPGELDLVDDVPVRPPPVHETEAREHSIEESFDRIIVEGRERLRRRWVDLLVTGATAGIEVAFGVLALLYVEHATGSVLLGGVAFSIGFVALLLGHSELFTEGFLVPVTVVAAGEARVRSLLKLWVGTFAGNLAGGALSTWVIDVAFPSLHHQAIVSARYYLDSGVGWRTFTLALLAGAAITLLTRMHNGTDSDVAKLVATVGIAFLLAGVRLFHSILDSLLAFAALETGHAPFGYLTWLRWLGVVVAGNMLGGLGLTTLLRLLRSRQRLLDHRLAVQRAVEAAPPAS
ncbi:MAG: formate/nitrite transporter family protein [Actinomycetota bacterium]|nr:formate/nitrite transporter family protein [Actinomycetota bacterium]